MKKFIIAAASAVAVLGLAACSDTDETTTQSVDEPAATETVPATPPATDNTTTQSVEPDGESEPAPAPAPAPAQ